MLMTPTLEKLKAMRLFGMASALEEQMKSSNYNDQSFEDRLGHLVDYEDTLRDNKKLENRLSRAKLRQKATLEDIYYRADRGIDKTTILTLGKCGWIKEHKNMIITGATGVGKSYIACALAHKACLKGYTSLYIRIPRLFNDLLTAKADGRYGKLLAHIAKIDLLILDDWGLSKLNEHEEKEFLEIVEDRYELRSTMIISQVPVSEWHHLIPNPTIADASLDRIVHSSHRIDLQGESLRKLEKGVKKKIKTDE